MRREFSLRTAVRFAKPGEPPATNDHLGQRTYPGRRPDVCLELPPKFWQASSQCHREGVGTTRILSEQNRVRAKLCGPVCRSESTAGHRLAQKPKEPCSLAEFFW